jgi:hypothetical protein
MFNLFAESNSNSISVQFSPIQFQLSPIPIVVTKAVTLTGRTPFEHLKLDLSAGESKRERFLGVLVQIKQLLIV